MLQTCRAALPRIKESNETSCSGDRDVIQHQTRKRFQLHVMGIFNFLHVVYPYWAALSLTDVTYRFTTYQDARRVRLVDGLNI